MYLFIAVTSECVSPSVMWPHGRCSSPGSPVHGIFQARVLESVAISSSRGSSWPRDWIPTFCISGRFCTIWATAVAQVRPFLLDWCQPLSSGTPATAVASSLVSLLLPTLYQSSSSGPPPPPPSACSQPTHTTVTPWSWRWDHVGISARSSAPRESPRVLAALRSAPPLPSLHPGRVGLRAAPGTFQAHSCLLASALPCSHSAWHVHPQIGSIPHLFRLLWEDHLLSEVTWPLECRSHEGMNFFFKTVFFPLVQCCDPVLRIVSNIGGPGLIPGQGTRSHMPQLRPGARKNSISYILGVCQMSWMTAVVTSFSFYHFLYTQFKLHWTDKN